MPPNAFFSRSVACYIKRLMAVARWAWKLLKLIFLGAFSVAVIYLVFANAFLNTPFLSLVAGFDPSFDIRYSRALTLFPGRVEIWNARILSEDANVRWEIKVKHLRTRLDTRELFHSSLLFTEVHGDGASFHLVMKPDQERRRARRKREQQYLDALHLPEAMRARPNALELALRTPLGRRRRAELIDRKRAKHWKVTVRGVDIESLTSIDVAEFSFRGEARASGEFFLWPGVQASVGPAKLIVESGEARLGGKPFARTLHGQGEIRFHPWIVDIIEGNDVFSRLDARASFSGTVAPVYFLDPFLKAASVRVDGSASPLTLEVNVKEGHLLPGTRLRSSRSRVTASSQAATLKGRATIRFDVVNSAYGRLAFDFADFTLHRNGDPSRASLIEGRSLKAFAMTPDLYLPHPFGRLRLEADLPDSRIPDLKAWSFVLGKDTGKVGLLGGSGQLQGRITASTDSKRYPPMPITENTGGIPTGLTLRVPQARVRYGSLEISADLAARGNIRDVDLSRFRARLTGSSAALSQMKITRGSNQHEVFARNGRWAEFELGDTWLENDSDHPFQGSGRLRVARVEPILIVYGEDHSVPKMLSSWLASSPLDGRITFMATQKGWDFPVLEGKLSSFRFNGKLRLSDKPTEGAFTLQSGLFRVGVRISDQGASLRLFPSQQWFEDATTPVLWAESPSRSRTRNEAGRIGARRRAVSFEKRKSAPRGIHKR